MRHAACSLATPAEAKTRTAMGGLALLGASNSDVTTSTTAVVGGGLRYDPGALFADRVSEFGPQPRGQPRACPDSGQRLGERGPGAKPFLAAPSPCVPDQPQNPCPVWDVTRPGADPTLEGDGEHPQLGPPDAVSSAVTRCTTRPPNVSDSTRSTARPPKSSRREASETESC